MSWCVLHVCVFHNGRDLANLLFDEVSCLGACSICRVSWAARRFLHCFSLFTLGTPNYVREPVTYFFRLACIGGISSLSPSLTLHSENTHI